MLQTVYNLCDLGFDVYGEPGAFGAEIKKIQIVRRFDHICRFLFLYKLLSEMGAEILGQYKKGGLGGRYFDFSSRSCRSGGSAFRSKGKSHENVRRYR